MECIQTATETCGGGITGHLMSQLIGVLLSSQCALSPSYPPDRTLDHFDSYDFIVVGGGSAGSALAARLSDNPDWSVLLIEAGGNPSQTSEVPGLLFNLQGVGSDWRYKTEPQENACRGKSNGCCKWPRGKSLGGSSMMNVMIYQTGNDNDYNQWKQSTNDERWQLDNLKKYFDQIQSKMNFFDDSTESLALIRNLILNAAQELGLKTVQEVDQIVNGTIGYFQTLGSVQNGVRLNSATLFLNPVGTRKNLHVIKNALVGKVLINEKNRTAEGVEVWLNNKWTKITTRKEVILSAGAINSAQILMLSGIGPKDHLESLNIPVHENLPVGKNLQDHTILDVNFELKNAPLIKSPNQHELLDSLYNYFMYKKGPLATIGITNVLGFINTKNSNAKYPNIQIHNILFPINDTQIRDAYLKCMNYNEKHVKQFRKINSEYAIFTQFPTLLKPKSKGYIQLKSKDPFESPIIEANYNSEYEDTQTLIEGIEHAMKLSKTQSLQHLGAEFIKLDIDECNELQFMSREYWECYVKNQVSTLYHPTGTARMGTDSKDSVVNSNLQVHGISNLRVVDASVIPEIPSCNTNAPSMMIGLHAADIIKESYQQANKNLHNEL